MEESKKERLALLLIDGGVAGRTQRFLTYEMRNLAKVSEFKPVLEEWSKKGYVQKFTVKNPTSRPTTIWRATETLPGAVCRQRCTEGETEKA